MGDPNSQHDLHSQAVYYSQLSRDDLLLELDRLIDPTQYYDAPSDRERKREGEGLWIRLRAKVAVFICEGRTKRGNETFTALLTAGGVAFVEETAKMILGAGILPGVTGAIAGAIAGLLYKELQIGIDDFCEAHYTLEDLG
jgi:hypothetical protein